jgi:hypothetical protein
MKNLVIGNATGYTWDHLKYWVNSLRQTGYSDDVVIVGSDMNGETVKKLTSEGIVLNLFGNRTEDGGVETKGPGVPHVERFFYLWTFLQDKKYDQIVMTDTRDVVFQKNPFKWLDKPLSMYQFVAASEGMRYKNEPWGNTNLYQAFGPHYYNLMKNRYINNVGVLAGTQLFVESLVGMIFQVSLGRPIPIVDQAVYNYLLTVPLFREKVFWTSHGDPWAVNLGTTIEAVASGSGDLGKLCENNQDELNKYGMNYEDVQPVIEDDGTIKTPGGSLYAIVHQWDRIPSLKAKIEKKYGDVNVSD